MMASRIVALLLAAIPAAAEAASACPPVTTQKDFDLSQYISKRWYIQQQMPTPYLPESQNFCVYAEYSLLSRPNLLGYTIQVHNHAEEQDGTVHDSGKYICAKQADASDPAKLSVGPCFIPSQGPYWVLSYDEAEGYALISGGQPTVETPDGCRTGTKVNSSGLWIFTRAQQRDEALVQKVRGIAKAQGFDLSVLKDVDQTNCGGQGQMLV